MKISPDHSRKIDLSWPKKGEPDDIFFPDALVDETVYLVTGKATNEAERAASENLGTEKFSETRRVRMKLFRWPTANAPGLLAIVQYDFADASPAMSCLSIGLMVQVVRNAVKWEVRNKYLLETMHHSSIQKIDLVDLNGDASDELIIESNSGGAGTADSSLQVFDLSRGRFDELLDTTSRLLFEDQDWHTQVLDIGRTAESRARMFCMTKTTLFKDGQPFDPPRISHPCYKRGDGVDVKRIAQRNEMIRPLR